MFLQKINIDQIAREKTTLDGTERMVGRDGDGDFKILFSNLVASFASLVPEAGYTIKTEAEFRDISPTHPWLCLSYPSIDLTTANYSTEFIDALRARKYTYDEFGTSTSEFSGSWAGNVFTLDDTTANNAMLAELAEDWLYHSSPVSNWRILSDGTTEFNITGINVTSRTITVNLDGETTSGTSIIIYTNRVYRETTKARHFSEAGLATYQAGGGKSGRLFRRDQMQGHEHLYIKGSSYSAGALSGQNVWWGTGIYETTGIVSSESNPTPRTGSETIAKSSSRYEYIYVGSYTA